MDKIDPLLKKALKIIADKGWSNFSLSDLADGKSVSLANVHSKFPSRLCLIEEFFRYVDRMTLENLDKFNEQEMRHDKLFSVIMTRFDVLEPHKRAVESILKDSWKDPLLIMGSLPSGINSISWLLQAANIDTTGIQGLFRIKVFSVFYLRIIWCWLGDSSENMDKTMVSVDNNLKRLDQIPGFF